MMHRKSLWTVMVATLVLNLSAVAWAQSIIALEPSTEPIHVRVLFRTDPAHQAVVAWTTTAKGEEHRLYVDTEPRDGDLGAYARQAPSIHDQAYTLREDEEAAGMAAWTHNVLLTDLKPATRYYLTVVSDGRASEEFYFITAPADDRPIALLLVGDSRVGGERTEADNNRRKVNEVMRELLETHPGVVAMAHGGDYTVRAYWSQLYWWLKDHTEVTTTEDNRLLPIIPARGNHDTDVGFEEMFWWPDAEHEYYYTTQLSDDVALFTLNTEISVSGEQRDWLEAELAKLRPDNRWVLGQWHRPAWPSVRNFNTGAPRRESWVPLFERFRIDLAFESHDHALKRTYPIHQGQIDIDRGLVYIGDGGGGVAQRQPDAGRWYLEVTGRHHHAHIIRFTDERLEGAAIDIDRQVIDQFTFLHDRRNAP